MRKADGALANVAIARGEKQVGYLYRERPIAEWDTGWRFFTGHEEGAYLGDPANCVVVSMAAVVEGCPSVAELLGAAPGTAYELGPDGRFVDVTGQV